MNKVLTILVLAAVTAALTAQKSESQFQFRNNCEEYPKQIDSLYVFDWNKTANIWVPSTIWQYENSAGKQDRLLFIRADSREPIRAWDYYYDANGNRNLEIATYWRNNSWVLTQKRESVFSVDNKIQNLLSSIRTNEEWVSNSFYYYEYEDSRLSKVTNQLMNPDGSYSDQSYSEYSYIDNQLNEVRDYRAADGSLKSVNQYNYNEYNFLTEFRILLPRADIQGSVELLPSKRRLYTYDDYSLLREVLFQDWNGASWDTVSKYVYYYTLDNSKKVAVCHNGHTICVSANALKAHLSHGDYLGSCTNEQIHGEKRYDDKGNMVRTPPFIVYPNPATDRITIKFEKDECYDIKRVELTDFYGKLIKSFNIKDNGDLTIYRANMRSGKYYIRLVGKDVYSAVVIFD